VVLNLPDLDAFLWIYLQHSRNQFLGSLVYCRTKRKCILAFDDTLDDVGVGKTCEWKLPKEKIVEHHTTSPNVDSWSVDPFFPRQYLGSHIFESTHIEVRVKTICYSADAKICDFNLQILLVD